MTKSFGELIGAEIYKCRSEKGWSREVVEKKSGIDAARIGIWELGKVSKPQLRLLQPVCKVLGIEEKIEELRERAKKKAEPSIAVIEERYVPSTVQPHLSPAPAIQRSSHYASQMLDVLGRIQEQQRLREFLDHTEIVDNGEKRFSWIQIAGVGGQGKSRLAYELMLEREEQWCAGFLTSDDLTEFKDHWTVWQPHRPYLLIFDYVVGREEEIGPVFRLLARRSEEFHQPVRMIFLERQRWDRGTSMEMEQDAKRRHRNPSSGSEGRADWFIKLAERRDGNDPALWKFSGNFVTDQIRMYASLDLNYCYARMRTWSKILLDWKPATLRKDFVMHDIVLSKRFSINWLNDIILS